MALINPEINDVTSVLHPARPPKEMASTSVLPDGRTKLRYNYSTLTRSMECMRATYYGIVKGYRPQFESPALIYGSAVHAFSEIAYTSAIADRKLLTLEEFELRAMGHPWKREGYSAFQKAFDAFMEIHKPLTSLPETDKRSSLNAAWLVFHFSRLISEDPYIAYVDDKGPFMERSFSLVVYEDEKIVIEIFGTIDFVLQHTVTGQLMPGDFKTSSSLFFNGSSFFDKEKPNHQYSGYMLGLREVFGLDVKDFMVQVIEVKARPKTVRGSSPSFPRQITTRTEDDFEEFRESIAYYGKLYLRALEDGIWPQGPVQSCAAYGACQFRQVCAAPKSMRQTILDNTFKRSL